LEKKSLATLINSVLLRDIANIDPFLIYYMCFLGDQEKFKSNLFNFETDSRELAKFDIISYDSPKNRSTHHVNPKLRPTSKKVIQELIDNKICEELSKFSEIKDENGKRIKIDREKFRQLFWERFTFEKDPNMLLENELIEIRKKSTIAPNNWIKKDEYGNSMFVKYYLDNELLIVNIEFICSCSKKYEINLPINEFLENKWKLNIECNDCKKVFYPSPDLFSFMLCF